MPTYILTQKLEANFTACHATFQTDSNPVTNLSPLLFILLIELLAQLIRSDPDVNGIELGGHEHKICLFAEI